ncbi:MAG: hypothetical protein ACI8TQ_000333 [Planctomycetota bacterium]|jgi:hypothetical protein
MQNCSVLLSVLATVLLGLLAPTYSAQSVGLKPYAHVIDLETGIGVAGAAVTIPGTNNVELSDAHGYVYFDGYQPKGKLAKAFTFPSSLGYGPALAGRSKTNDRLLNLFVPPVGSAMQNDDGVPKSNGGFYYSRLIDHTAGTGAVPIRFLSAPEREVEGVLSYFPFDMEIDVPADAYDQDFRIRVYPLPTFAPLTNPGYAPDLSHGQWHVDAIDANGNLIPNATFTKGILFRTKPFWGAVDLTTLYNGPNQPASIQVSSFNFNSLKWIKETVNVYSYPADGRTGIELNHFSIYSSESCIDCHPTPPELGDPLQGSTTKGSVGSSAKSGGSAPFEQDGFLALLLRSRGKPTLKFSLGCIECVPRGTISVFNGQGIGTANFLLSESSGWSLGANVEAAISATLSVESGSLAKFLMQAKIETGLSLTVGVNGQINGSVNKMVGGSVGGQLGPANFNGTATVYAVNQIFDVYIDDKFVGQSDPIPAYATAGIEGTVDGAPFSILGPCEEQCPEE